MHKRIQFNMAFRLIMLLLACLIVAGVVITIFDSWVSGAISFILLIFIINQIFLLKKRRLMLSWVKELIDKSQKLNGVRVYDSNQNKNWKLGSIIFKKKQQAVKVQYKEQGVEVFFSGLPQLGVRLLEWDIVSNIVIIELEDLSSPSKTAEIYFNDIQDCCYLPWDERFEEFIPDSVGLNIDK